MVNTALRRNASRHIAGFDACPLYPADIAECEGDVALSQKRTLRPIQFPRQRMDQEAQKIRICDTTGPGRSSAKLLSKYEARSIASNIAKLPKVLRSKALKKEHA